MLIQQGQLSMQVEVVQLKGHQSAGGGDSGRGHLAEIIQAGGQAGASRITARRNQHQ